MSEFPVMTVMWFQEYMGKRAREEEEEEEEGIHMLPKVVLESNVRQRRQMTVESR